MPYATPGSLDELQAPTSGVVRVRPHLNTSQGPTFDHADAREVIEPYSAVARDGSAHDQRTFLDRAHARGTERYGFVLAGGHAVAANGSARRRCFFSPSALMGPGYGAGG